MLKVSLVLGVGEKAGKRVRVQKGAFFIGRHATCHFRIKNSVISRWHCVFLSDENQVVLTDLGSQNGTFVNGMKLSEGDTCRLQHRDVVRIGGAEFRLSVRNPETKKGVYFRSKGAAVELVTLNTEPRTKPDIAPEEPPKSASEAMDLDTDEMLRELDELMGSPLSVTRDGDALSSESSAGDAISSFESDSMFADDSMYVASEMLSELDALTEDNSALLIDPAHVNLAGLAQDKASSKESKSGNARKQTAPPPGKLPTTQEGMGTSDLAAEVLSRAKRESDAKKENG